MSDVADALDRLTHLVRDELRARGGRETHHRPGQRPLRRMDLRAYLEGIPGLPSRFARQVPPEMWAQLDDATVEVACPCGQAHRVARERLVKADCGRVFVWDGAQKVRVAGTPE